MGKLNQTKEKTHGEPHPIALQMLGRSVRVLRESAGLTISEASEVTSIGALFIDRLEAGQHEMPWPRLLTLVDGLLIILAGTQAKAAHLVDTTAATLKHYAFGSRVPSDTKLNKMVEVVTRLKSVQTSQKPLKGC